MNAKIRYGLSAAVLALIAVGAPAPDILDQFLDEKEGNHTTAYRDGAGIDPEGLGGFLAGDDEADEQGQRDQGQLDEQQPGPGRVARAPGPRG